MPSGVYKRIKPMWNKGIPLIFEEYKIKSLEEALNCEEFWNINNGRTLCRKCHNLTKGKK